MIVLLIRNYIVPIKFCFLGCFECNNHSFYGIIKQIPHPFLPHAIKEWLSIRYLQLTAPLTSRGSVFEDLRKGKKQPKTIQRLKSEKNKLKPPQDKYEASLKIENPIGTEVTEILSYRQKTIQHKLYNRIPFSER